MHTQPDRLRTGDAAMITAKQLKLARVLLEMSQKQFADDAGISEQTIQRLEKLPGELHGLAKTVRKIEKTIEGHGVVFVEGGAIIKKPDD